MVTKGCILEANRDAELFVRPDLRRRDVLRRNELAASPKGELKLSIRRGCTPKDRSIGACGVGATRKGAGGLKMVYMQPRADLCSRPCICRVPGL